MKKRILSLALALVMALSCAPIAGAAVSSSDAQVYTKLILSTYQKNPYLIDFDGDGRDELLLVWDTDENYNRLEKIHYEIWSGNKKLVSSSAKYDSLNIYTNKNNPSKKYLVDVQFMALGDSYWTTYTLSSERWTKADSFHGSINYYGNNHYEKSYHVNGKTVDEDTFDSCLSAYQYSLACSTEREYDEFLKLQNKLATTIRADLPYSDVLSSLSQKERNALYEDLLGSLAVAANPFYFETGIDTSRITDDDIGYFFVNMNLCGCISFEDFGGSFDETSCCAVFSEREFTHMTQQYLGKTVNYASHTISTRPNWNTANTWFHYYKGNVYVYPAEAGYIGDDFFQPKNLYKLSDRLYCATFIHTYSEDGDTSGAYNSRYYYSALVNRNTDGTWTLVRLYPVGYIPTTNELSAFVAPSSWAKAEVEAADAAGLIPDLTGDPGWQDASTRLQFCQLAVQLAETALGETLPAAPANTFTDCSDLAVRKAYAAGIVNGMTETTFSPNGTLTREQLATMLWRAVNYIQTQSGEQALTGGGSLTGYTDAGSVSGYAKEAVSALNKNGIMKGTSNTALSPKGSCTVEQSVLLSYRTFLKLN